MTAFSLQSTSTAACSKSRSLTDRGCGAGLLAEYISCLHITTQLPLEAITLSNRYVFFAATNHHHLHEFLQHSMDLRYEAMRQTFAAYSALVRGPHTVHLAVSAQPVCVTEPCLRTKCCVVRITSSLSASSLR